MEFLQTSEFLGAVVITAVFILVIIAIIWFNPGNIIHSAEYDMQQDYESYREALFCPANLAYPDKILEGIEAFKKEHCKYVPEHKVEVYARKLRAELSKCLTEYC